MLSNDAFRPAGPTFVISAPTSAPPDGVNVFGQTETFTPPAGGDCVMLVFNPGPSLVWLAYGTEDSAPTNAVAPVGGTPQSVVPLPAGSIQTFDFTWNTFFSALAATATQTIYLTPGMGV